MYINIYIYIDIYILKCQKKKTTNTHSDLKEALKRLEFQGFCVFCSVLGLSFAFFFFAPFCFFGGLWVGDPFEEGERRAGSTGGPPQLPISLPAAPQEPSERALV